MKIRKRGFEVVNNYSQSAVTLPSRQTKGAAGYDFEAADEVVVPSLWKLMAKHFFSGDGLTVKATLIPTGVKAYMKSDEYLQLSIRSGMALKSGLILANGVGVVDSDYYNNDNNDGHIMFAVYNFGFVDKVVKKGDRIGQGVFLSFLKTDNDFVVTERSGGFGSTGKK